MLFLISAVQETGPVGGPVILNRPRCVAVKMAVSNAGDTSQMEYVLQKEDEVGELSSEEHKAKCRLTSSCLNEQSS